MPKLLFLASIISQGVYKNGSVKAELATFNADHSVVCFDHCPVKGLYSFITSLSLLLTCTRNPCKHVRVNAHTLVLDVGCDGGARL